MNANPESSDNPEGRRVINRVIAAGSADWSGAVLRREHWDYSWIEGGKQGTLDLELPEGCYEFSVNAQDQDGLKSAWSDVVSTADLVQ